MCSAVAIVRAFRIICKHSGSFEVSDSQVWSSSSEWSLSAQNALIGSSSEAKKQSTSRHSAQPLDAVSLGAALRGSKASWPVALLLLRSCLVREWLPVSLRLCILRFSMCSPVQPGHEADVVGYNAAGDQAAFAIAHTRSSAIREMPL